MNYLQTRWKCTKLDFMKGNNTNIVYHYYLCFKHRLLYFLFYLIYARKFGSCGNIVTCNDEQQYVVVHNDFQSTIIIYRDTIFSILLCCTKIYPFRSIMFTYDIEVKNDHMIVCNPRFERKCVIKKHERISDLFEFQKILQMFTSVISYFESSGNTLYIDTFHHIRDLHTHLLYLCERPITLIQRMFRKAISDPNYKLCRSRLLNEYAILQNELH